MVFAALVIERPPLEWSGLIGALGQWLGDAGIYAFLWLLLLGLSYLVVPEFRRRSPWGWLHIVMATLGALAAAGFLLSLVLFISRDRFEGAPGEKPATAITAKAAAFSGQMQTRQFVWSLAGLAALAACAAPIVRDLFQRRLVGRRIWAIARLGIKEAWSRGIVWASLFIPLIYLYADMYLNVRPEDQLRTRVGIAYFSMAILFILSAVLLGAFSIPGDLRTQNIFTIVTKPVERYEIVLGRFLGYAVLLLAELIAVAGVSYIYVARGLTDQAVQESYHARVPLFANDLYYYNTGPLPGKWTEGESVGREWKYRSYIGVPSREARQQGVQFAIWEFADLPGSLLNRSADETVALEFSFDIFRTTVGQEGKAVYCTFTFARGDLPLERVEKLHGGLFNREYEQQYAEALKRNLETGKRGAELDALNMQRKKEIYWNLFAKLGIWQIQGIGVIDNNTQSELIPAKVFKVLADSHSTLGAKGGPMLRILVNVEPDNSSRHQRLGVAKADLYVLVEDRPFWLNFFKGAACIFLIACVVLGLAIAASTYLSGIVSLLMTLVIFLGGLFLPFVRALAMKQVPDAAGPFESLVRLARGKTAAVPLDKLSSSTQVIESFDYFFRQWLGFAMSVLPRVGDLNPTDYVANGFDITWGTLFLLNRLLPTAGYLLPWAILAYYLMKSREIANP